MRPTAFLRQLLVLESLQSFIEQEMKNLTAQMSEEGIRVLDRQDRDLDVWIQYRTNDGYDEATFMRKMLDAEVVNRAKRSGIAP